MNEKDCIFCKIIKGEIPSYKVYEDSNFYAFLDINPLKKGHSLIIPKDHYTDIHDLPDEISSKILIVGKKIIKAYDKILKPAGYNFFQSNGEVAGQEIMHYHIHLLPRYKDQPGLSNIFHRQYKPEEAELRRISKESLSVIKNF